MNAHIDIPDVRDGLRPVHRKILSVMYDAGLLPDRPYRRSAKIIGEVRQRFPPQGGRSAYNALVRMVRDFELRYPLLDGQGNFGSIDGDPPAASPYMEVRLSKVGAEMLADRRDGAAEPSVLSSSFPNLLANGAWSATTIIPPHNLREVVSAIVHLIDNPEATAVDLGAHIKGPDFPTGACIPDVGGIREYRETGRGRIAVRVRTEIETSSDATRIVVTEIPYRVDTSSMIVGIAEAVRGGRLQGISDLRNESDRDGLRIVIDLEAGANPRTMPLRELLARFIADRVEAIGANAGVSKPDSLRILKEELVRVAAAFGDRRRTEIAGVRAAGDTNRNGD